MRKTTVWPLCSIFSNHGHVFQWIKNPHISSMQVTLRNIHTKFGSNWSSSFEKLLTTMDDDDKQRNDDGHQVIAIVHVAFGHVK